ncbi:hypothetical protein [Bordetella genomosp. 13]|uniref:hypothetical protein n=1 Tax=Bordetella genomosp. 13 TaxID=463040 RepID=UPI0011A23BCF|nr:hypothetical protein [Bordetella genomosp. 13]
MFRTIAAAAALAGLAGCAGSVQTTDLESGKPILFLSVRSADDVYACIQPTVDQWGRAADVARFPAEHRVDVTVYQDNFPQRQDYYLLRVEPTPGGSASRLYSTGADHPRIPAAKVEDLLRGCTT